MNNKNTFEPGTAVSMPNLDLLNMPASGFTHNTGLDAALKVETQDIRENRHLPDIIAGLSKPGPPHYPSYLPSSAIIDISKSKYTPSDFQAGRIYRLGCNGGTAKIDPDIILIVRKVVLLTSCDVQLGAGVALEDAVIATTSSSTASIKGPSGVRLGRIDNCQPGGGAQLLTLGGVSARSVAGTMSEVRPPGERRRSDRAFQRRNCRPPRQASQRRCRPSRS